MKTSEHIAMPVTRQALTLSHDDLEQLDLALADAIQAGQKHRAEEAGEDYLTGEDEYLDEQIAEFDNQLEAFAGLQARIRRELRRCELCGQTDPGMLFIDDDGRRLCEACLD
jgi:hypothetical protein